MGWMGYTGWVMKQSNMFNKWFVWIDVIMRQT